MAHVHRPTRVIYSDQTNERRIASLHLDFQLLNHHFVAGLPVEYESICGLCRIHATGRYSPFAKFMIVKKQSRRFDLTEWLRDHKSAFPKGDGIIGPHLQNCHRKWLRVNNLLCGSNDPRGEIRHRPGHNQ